MKAAQAAGEPEAAETAAGQQRLDQWLWHARFFKTRSLAARHCVAGGFRVSGRPVSRASHRVRPGDILTFPYGREIRVVRVLELADHRGPAPQARRLYAEVEPEAALRQPG